MPPPTGYVAGLDFAMRSSSLGDGGLRDAPLRDAHSQRVEGIGVVLQAHAVDIEKDLRGEEPHPLIAIHEGVVRNDVEQVGCRHRKQPVVRAGAAE